MSVFESVCVGEWWVSVEWVWWECVLSELSE